MSDFNIKITVRNARLLRRIRERFGTPAEMCRQTGVHQTGLSALITMRESPVKKDGSLTVIATKVCEALGCYPEDIWPKHIEKVKLARASREVELSSAEVERIIDAPSEVQQRLLLERWYEQLSDRERIAIKAAQEGWTYDELGQELGGVTRERARQIQLKAFRKIRGRAYRDGVRSFAEAAE